MDDITAKKIEAFFTQYKHHEYKKGEIIIRAEDNPTGVFYLNEGYVKTYVISKKGDEFVVNLFKPVVSFPMSWAINETPNEYYYEAITDASVWKAPREDVVTFIKSNPDVLYNLLSRVYKGTDGILTKMTYMMSGKANGRLITELISYSKRFGNRKDNKIEIKISEVDLAAQSGLTRETVSREMKVLKDNGFVTLSKHMLVIKDLPSLEKELIAGI